MIVSNRFKGSDLWQHYSVFKKIMQQSNKVMESAGTNVAFGLDLDVDAVEVVVDSSCSAVQVLVEGD